VNRRSISQAPPVVCSPQQLKELVRDYESFTAFAIDVETMGAGETRGNPWENEVFWVSLAGPGRADVIPCGHPVGRLLQPAQTEKVRERNPETNRMRTVTHKVPPQFSPPPPQLWRSEVFEALGPLLFSDRRKVGHNVKFDLESVAKYYGGRLPPPPYGDTMIAARLVEENHLGAEPYSLGACAKRELDFSYDKKLGRLGPENFPFDQAARYSFLDAKTTWLLWNKYQRQLAYEGVWDVFEIEMRLLQVIMDMEQTGTPINIRRLKELDDDLDGEQGRLQRQIEKANGGPINLNANRQVAELVYDKLKHKCVSFTATGQRSVDKGALSAFEKDAVVKAILDYSQIQKLRSSFTRPLQEQVDAKGRIHPQFIQVGPVTGRMACRHPNLQQQPARSELGKRVRECFEAPPGYKLIVADYSQVELRILAHFTDDPTLKRAYAEGLDLHTLTAMRAFHTKTPTPEQRARAKNVNFSVAYQGGPHTLQARYGIPLREGEKIIEAFYATYRLVAPWAKAVVLECKRTYRKNPPSPPYVTTIIGRKRRLPEIFWSDRGVRSHAERQAINTRIQGTSAEITKLAMIGAFEKLAPLGGHLIMTIHDEIVALVPEAVAEEAKILMAQAMEGVTHPFEGGPILSVPLVVDIKICEKWSEK